MMQNTCQSKSSTLLNYHTHWCNESQCQLIVDWIFDQRTGSGVFWISKLLYFGFYYKFVFLHLVKMSTANSVDKKLDIEEMETEDALLQFSPPITPTEKSVSNPVTPRKLFYLRIHPFLQNSKEKLFQNLPILLLWNHLSGQFQKWARCKKMIFKILTPSGGRLKTWSANIEEKFL